MHEGDVKFISTLKYNSYLTLLSPVKPVYKTYKHVKTESVNEYVMMRPFPTLNDLKSMKHFCEHNPVIFENTDFIADFSTLKHEF
jgi:hypothetical protein